MSGQPSKEDFGEILDHIDIEYWLNREGVEYKVTRGRNGVQLNLKECPVCGNANWKVYIGATTGLGNCFHGDCEAKFSKWSFIKAELGNLTNKEIAEHIKAVAREQGWQPKHKQEVQRPKLGNLHFPASFELPILGKDSKLHNLKYLADRGISIETAKAFGLRFCQQGSFSYIDSFGQKKRQSFDNRIIIPVRDLNGKLVSYQGRDITGLAEKKYLFPSGYASTAAFLYNGNNAYGCVDIAMGEGAFDVMAIHQAFSEDDALCNVGVIGSFGKHLSYGDEETQFAELLKLKGAGLQRLTFMWDGERRAIQDAIEAALMVRKCGITVRIAILPPGKDPNEIPPEMVRSLYRSAIVVNEMSAVTLKLQYGVKK
ncbi:toprim domain-containing protein [Acinetobacter baumannii]|uniref:toprim domain-containing protein n=1 Tax=Acinetobacter baumannii TaxID=470 RepID=UPI001899EFC8|nr:toprim domain-containing protein [Acinetobacter baumannii]MBF6813647.1 DNA primase [Acinetobacter baumannii]MBF6914199.1 toprim domain-containing protein [Acinetobacter baumannii]MBF6974544.1 toprim domain-containing protein [Acinetobacter baumannii]